MRITPHRPFLALPGRDIFHRKIPEGFRVIATSKGAPFAFIADYNGFPDEEEVLFSMHTVFRVSDI